MTTDNETPTVQDDHNTVLCEALKRTIREEIVKELSFVNEKAQEQIANNICDKVYKLLMQGSFDSLEESERLLYETSKKMGW